MKSNRRLIHWAVILLVLGLIWDASERRPGGPDAGFAAHDLPENLPPQRPTLRVATFNIHGCKGRDDRRDVDRVARCLEGTDIVALNEVHARSVLAPLNQAQMLGERLGRGWIFAPADRKWHCRAFGNGVLVDRPLNHWQVIPLPQKYDNTFRNITLFTCKHQEQTVHGLVTHISRKSDRERQNQLRMAIHLFLTLRQPAILLGDLNSTGDDPQLRELIARPDVADPVADYLGEKTPERIDWILTRGFSCVEAGIVEQGASDHPMIWAELALQPPDLSR